MTIKVTMSNGQELRILMVDGSTHVTASTLRFNEYGYRVTTTIGQELRINPSQICTIEEESGRSGRGSDRGDAW